MKNRELLFGTWIQMLCPEAVEIMGRSYDFVVIDTEHGHFGLEHAIDLIRASNAVNVAPLVRVIENSPTLILKALDMGAQGIVVPGVSSVKDAVTAVKAAKYAPLGNRGACPCIRSAGHMSKDWSEYACAANDNTIVCLLVEGPEGVSNFEEIIKIPGVDMAMLGPFDLSVSLGVGGQLKHPLVIEKLEHMTKLANKYGVVLACNIFDSELEVIEKEIKYWMSLGSKVILVGGDKFIFVPAVRKVQSVLDRYRK